MLYSACSYYRTYVAYGMAELQQVPDLPPVVPHLRRAFCELVGVELEKCETRFGWWTGNPDSEFHLDSPQGLALENKSASIGGPTTEVAVGLCDRIRKEHFEIIVRPRPNARVYSLDEGVAYRMGPGTAHREPLCVEPANRVFFRVLSS